MLAEWLLFLFEIEGEMTDRLDINFPGKQIQLFQRLQKINPNIINVLINGAPISLEPILSSKAILEAYYPGFYGAKSIVKTLVTI